MSTFIDGIPGASLQSRKDGDDASVRPGASIGGIEQVASRLLDALKRGEMEGLRSITHGESDFAAVQSILGAQRALQATLAVRDRVVSAIQDISHMSI